MGAQLNDIAGNGADSVIAVGYGGFVTRFHDEAWQTLSEPVNLPCRSIHGVSETEVWAACGDSLQHWDGSDLSPVTVPGMQVGQVWVADVGDVWTIGYTDDLSPQRKLAHGVDGTWSVLDSVESPYLVTGSGKDDIWVLADDLTDAVPPGVFRQDGDGWLDISPAVSVGVMYDLWVRTPTDARLMTQDNAYRWDGESWAKAPGMGGMGGMGDTCSTIHGTSETNVWALNSHGLQRWNGEDWENEFTGDASFCSLWAAGPNELYLESDSDGSPRVYHSDGSTFLSPMGKWNGDLFWVEGTLFVAGDHGIARYQ